MKVKGERKNKYYTVLDVPSYLGVDHFDIFSNKCLHCKLYSALLHWLILTAPSSQHQSETF